MQRHDVHSADGVVAAYQPYGKLFVVGTGAPTNSQAGFAKGCIYLRLDGSAGSQFYINEGTSTSTTWTAMGTGATLASLTITALTATTAALATVTTPALVETGVETAAIGASTAGLGTNAATAAALPAGTAKVYPTTAADDTVGVIIHTNDKVTGRTLFIGNGVSNKILKVYGPTGAVINGAAADAAFSTASGKGAIVVCLSGAGNTWLAW